MAKFTSKAQMGVYPQKGELPCRSSCRNGSEARRLKQEVVKRILGEATTLASNVCVGHPSPFFAMALLGSQSKGPEDCLGANEVWSERWLETTSWEPSLQVALSASFCSLHRVALEIASLCLAL